MHDDYRIIEEHRVHYPVTHLLSIAGIPRDNYYKWRTSRQRPKEAGFRDREIQEHMVAIHLAHPYFGYPRMKVALREAGYVVNHKKVWRLMKELSLTSVIRRSARPPCTRLLSSIRTG